MSTAVFIMAVAAHYFVSLFMHSFYLHRYATHKQFLMSPFWERFFYFFTWFFQGPAFLDPKSYAKLHLGHHDFSDTEKDPHSPLNFSVWKHGLDFFFAIWPMMWETKKIFIEIRAGKHELAKLYQERKFPEWKHFESFSNSLSTTLVFGFIYVLLYAFFAPVWWVWLLLPFSILNGPIQGAIVNWCGHMWGYRRYKELNDNSRNTPVLNILTLGELNQNNHHKDPQNPNFAKAWHELDLIYPVIRLLDLVKVIRISNAI